MNTNQWINASNKLYAFLMRLYPKAYRQEFSSDMQQVFRAECGNRYEKKGLFGIVLYWFKVLPDLTYTALLEHISSPTATWGLMEPVPNAPLPWKGVFLVLLPGLVYVVAQISQFTGKYWYYLAYYRAGFYLMIPVVIVWAISKKFPVWGLIPVGLFFQFLQSMTYSMLNYLTVQFANIPAINSTATFMLNAATNPITMLILVLAIIIILLIRYRKLYPQSRKFYIWLIAMGVLAVCYMANTTYMITNVMFPEVTLSTIMQRLEFSPHYLTWQLYEFLKVILLVCIGTLFMKKHGFFSIFVFVGYILPIMVVGYPWNIDDLLKINYAIPLIATAVILYRVLLAIIAPALMSRMSNQQSRKRVIVIPIAFAIGINFVMSFYQTILFPDTGSFSFQSVLFAAMVQGITLFGFLLAISLYSAGEFEPMEKPEQRKHSAEIYVYS